LSLDAKGQRKGNAGSGKALNLAQLSDLLGAGKTGESVGEKRVPACGQSHLPEQVKNAAQKPMNSGFCSGWVCEYMVFLCLQAGWQAEEARRPFC